MSATSAHPKTYSSAIRDASNYTRWILDTFRPFIHGRTLELGFGHDSYFQVLRGLVPAYTGADIDESAVVEAKAAHPDTPFFLWDVSDPAGVDLIGRGAYDTVLCINMLEHVADHELAVNNMLELLAPGGRLLLFVPAFNGLYNSMDHMAGHHRRYNRTSLAALFEGHKVTVEAMDYFNPLGGLGWFVNGVLGHEDLDADVINAQIRTFDRYVLPVSRALMPLTKAWFGQSLAAVVRKEKAIVNDSAITSEDEQTIRDFGRQWTEYTDNSAYYGSTELLADIIAPLIPLEEVAGLRTAEIGSGTGRIVNMLVGAGAESVVAVEPSDAIHALRRNTAQHGDKVEILHVTGDRIPAGLDLDLVVSIGVLHHIVDPAPVVKAVHAALRPGGRFLIWVYGHEGNELYLAIFGTLRRITTRLPHKVLDALCHLLLWGTDLYGALCKLVPLPLRDYMLNYFSKLARDKRHLIIYDQLNPAHADYYKESEVRQLLEQGGFVDVATHHRHGYSWTAVGRKAL